MNNEDTCYIGNGFVVIADGMGGESSGDLASRIAVDAITRVIENDLKREVLDKNHIERISRLAIEKANAELNHYIDCNPDTIGMGTTILLAVYRSDHLFLTWCGDSHCYLFRGNHLRSLTKDHSYVQELVDAGAITTEEAFTHPDSNLITRYAGGSKETCHPDFSSYRLYDDDVVILCTDGLSGYCMNSAIENKIKNTQSLAAQPEELRRLARAHGSDDDITIVTIRIRNNKSYNSISEWIKRILCR